MGISVIRTAKWEIKSEVVRGTERKLLYGKQQKYAQKKNIITHRRNITSNLLAKVVKSSLILKHFSDLMFSTFKKLNGTLWMRSHLLFTIHQFIYIFSSVKVVGIPGALWIQFRACLDCVLVAAGYSEMDRSSANLFRICSTLRIDVWFDMNSLNNINPNVSFLYPMFVSFGLGAPFFLPLSRFYAEKFSLLIKYFCSEIRDGGSSKATRIVE